MSKSHQHILITAGPTRESLDPVRYLSNHSTGEMGYALARAARRRGSQVTLISGPVSLQAPAGACLVPVTSAADLEKKCRQFFPRCDTLLMAAAVCDFRAKTTERTKRSREEGLRLILEKTPDILASLAHRKGGRVVIGFCLETSDWIIRAKRKIVRKELDGIVANSLSSRHNPFGAGRTSVALIDSEGNQQLLRHKTKKELAEIILDWADAMTVLKRDKEERCKKEFKKNQKSL